MLDVSAVIRPRLLEELEGDGGVDRHDMQRTHCDHAAQVIVFREIAFLGSSFSVVGDFMA